MIPLRLQLKNFLSYGPQEQTINFEPYQLICLSGKNGHGKSALLDAMTWAVWGQARKTSNTAKADSDLLRIGQTFMAVSFDFAFNGHTYRIKREYGKTFAKPYASLDFGILDGQAQKVRSLTEKTIRSTQESIEKTIGIDYETFINTAFFKQGHANEFSKKSPKERKDILASILNLHQYEDLKKYIQDRVREYTTQELHLQETQKKLQLILEGQGPALQEYDAVIKNHTALAERELVLSQKHLALTQQQTLLAKKQQESEKLAFQRAQLHTAEQQQHTELLSLFALWRIANQHRRALPDRTTLEHEKKVTQELLEKEQAVLQRHLQLKETFLAVKEEKQNYEVVIKEGYRTTIQQKRIALERLLAQKTIIAHQIKLSDSQTTALAREHQVLEKEKVTIEKKIAEHQNNNIQEIERVFEKRKAHYHRWISYLQRIHQEQKERGQKQQFTHNNDNPSCPLCEQNLSASRKNFLKTKLVAEEKFALHQRTRLEKATKRLKEILIEQHATLQGLHQQQKDHELAIRTLHEVSNKLCVIDNQHQELLTRHSQAGAELTALEQVIAQEQQLLHQEEQTAKNCIAENNNLKEFEKKLASLEKELQENTYNPAHLQELSKNLDVIKNNLQRYETQAEEQALQGQRKQAIISLLRGLKIARAEQFRLKEQQLPYLAIEQEQKVLTAQQMVLADEHKKLQQAKEALAHHKGRLEEQKKYFESQHHELKVCEQKLEELANKLFEYSALTSALGKNGIQALLIEDALPEIEHEANVLLGQLTDNQTHIIIESVRDLKKGGTRETLDINISDPMGIRPYELFSGGEAFRIDFALRIAISKLLARRAGTSLQTLIIDEGFGSQDDEGLTRLMDSIYKIQNNFSKIIIVSHLSAMKDQFPVHFVISKGPQGTQVNVLEQD